MNGINTTVMTREGAYRDWGVSAQVNSKFFTWYKASPKACLLKFVSGHGALEGKKNLFFAYAAPQMRNLHLVCLFLNVMIS